MLRNAGLQSNKVVQSGDPLKEGEKIRDTESGLDLEELVSQYVHGKVN